MRRYSCGGGRMTTRLWSCLAVLLVVIVSVGEAQQQAPPPPPQTAPPATPRAAPSSGPRASTVTVTVTDDAGTPVQGVTVTVTGPVTRTVTTIANGTARLLGMRSGTYRLRFEHQGFITLERDVTMRAGAVPEVDVTLSPGTAPPPPVVETPSRENAPPES